MSGVYSIRLGWAELVNPAVTVVLGTVPVGKVWIARDVEVRNNGNVTTVNGRIRVDITGGHVYFAAVPTIPAGGNYQWTGRVVLKAGEVVNWTANAGDTTIVVSGYQLEAS